MGDNKKVSFYSFIPIFHDYQGGCKMSLLTNGKQTHISYTFVKIIVQKLATVKLPIHLCGMTENKTGVEHICTDRRSHSIKTDEKKS